MSRVENYINDELKKHKKICFALLDSENFKDIVGVAKKVESLGASAILVGGSSAIDQLDLDKLVISIKSIVSIPVILFPGNVTGVSPNADAILFTSLLNSEDPYFISGAAIDMFNLLSTSYVLLQWRPRNQRPSPRQTSHSSNGTPTHKPTPSAYRCG